MAFSETRTATAMAATITKLWANKPRRTSAGPENPDAKRKAHKHQIDIQHGDGWKKRERISGTVRFYLHTFLPHQMEPSPYRGHGRKCRSSLPVIDSTGDVPSHKKLMGLYMAVRLQIAFLPSLSLTIDHLPN